jgi:hypothetical protein
MKLVKKENEGGLASALGCLANINIAKNMISE